MGDWTVGNGTVEISAANLWWVNQQIVLQTPKGGFKPQLVFTDWYNKELGWTAERATEWAQANTILFSPSMFSRQVGNRENVQPRFIVMKGDTQAFNDWISQVNGISKTPPDEDCFVFANVFSMQTKDGGKTFEKVLTNSGKFKCRDLDTLKAASPQLIIEEVSEDEVIPVNSGGATPQNPFIVIDGEKIPLDPETLDPRIPTIESIINEQQSGANAISIIITEELSLIDTV